MKNSFKTLAAILSSITLISSLSPIKAMDTPSQEATSKCSSDQDKCTEKVVKRLVKESFDSKLGFIRYDFDISSKPITPEEVVSATCEAQKDMHDIESKYFSKVSSIFHTYEKFASAIIVYNFLFTNNLEDCKFLDHPGITCMGSTYSVPANGFLSYRSIIKILCIADPEISEAFKADRMTVIYRNNLLLIRFCLNGEVVREVTLG